MKITYLNAHIKYDDGRVNVTVGMDFPTPYSLINAQMAVVEALNSIDGFTIPESLRRTEDKVEEAAPVEEAEVEEAPKRRGRKAKVEVEAAPAEEAEAEAEEAEAVAEETAPAPKRRGRKAKVEVEAAPAEEAEAEEAEVEEAEAEEISDIQLAKAASVAASKTNPETVTAVLEEFGVEKVNDLAQEDRETFLTTLNIVVG